MRRRLPPRKLESLICQRLEEFYRKRLEKLEKLRLRKVLERKNPYLFRALGVEIAAEIVEQILQAYVSSSDETIFGNIFFEPIAREVSGGKVSDAEGVDFAVEKPRRYTAVALKSGPNVFNASQKKRQNQEFNALKSRLLKLNKQFDPLLGHAYGKVRSDPSRDQVCRELSGQAFWAEITGDPNFYLKLMRLMKGIPARHKERQSKEWAAAINRFTLEFARDFCFEDGKINWNKLVDFVSKEKAVPAASVDRNSS